MNIQSIINNIQNFRVEDLFLTPEVLNLLPPQTAKLIGSGGLGTVFPIPNSNLVVKLNSPCAPKWKNLSVYCYDMNTQQKIIRIPHENKTLLIISNYISEGLVGGFLNFLIPYTPHFISTYGIYLSKINRTSYIFQEKALTDLHNRLNSAEDVYLFLFQIAHALMVAQTTFRLNHRDLHIGNIVYTLNTGEYQYHYVYNGQSFTIYVRNPFVVKIIDFGFSRMETNEIVIHPKLESVDYRFFGAFNPYYDFISLMGSILFYQNKNLLSAKVFQFLGIVGVTEIMQMIFKTTLSLDDIRHQFYLEDFWRPINPDIRPSPGTTFSNIFEITHWLAKRLIQLRVGNYNAPTNNFIPSTTLPGFEILPRIPMLTNAATVDNGIEYRSLSYKFPIRRFNRTNVNPSKGYKDVYVHFMIINLPLVLPLGYSFKTICCKVDPMAYMEDKIGVAINAAYFENTLTYEPIGDYRQLIQNRFFESNLRVDPDYINYYGFVVINGPGDIRIENFDTINKREAKNIFMSGPILIWNGEIIMNENIIEQTIKNPIVEESVKGILLFQCRNPVILKENPEQYLLPTEEGSVRNCSQIQSGELAHGGNPNPRSMLVIRKGGQEVVLVVVEGRNPRSDGADFVDLVLLALELNAEYAINLDGGTSSNMAWRSPLNPNVVGTINRIDTYPVGNILALTK